MPRRRPKPAAKPVKPIGQPLNWTAADIERLAEVTPEDVACARAFWRRAAPKGAKRLVDAKVGRPADSPFMLHVRKSALTRAFAADADDPAEMGYLNVATGEVAHVPCGEGLSLFDPCPDWIEIPTAPPGVTHDEHLADWADANELAIVAV